MFSIRLGLKNLLRQKRRNIITILIIAFSFLGYLFVESLMNGMEEMSFESIQNFETGNIQIAEPDYWEERDELPIKGLVVWNEELEGIIDQTDGIIGISTELKFPANLNNGIDEMPIMGLGINPKRYNEVFQTGEYFVEGSLGNLNENKAVIGTALAELMDLKKDDHIVLLIRTKEDTFNTIDLEVGGIIRTPNPMLNSRIVLMPLDIARRSLNVGNMVSTVSLKTSPAVPEKSIIKSLEDSFQVKKLSLQAYSWRESAADVIALSTAKKGGVGAILSIVLLIGIVGIVNNIILSGIERTAEIGMMKALGMKEWEIVSVFMVEAAGIGISGGLAGCLLGCLAIAWLVSNGFNVANFGDWSQYGIPIVDRIYGVWNYQAFLYIFVLSVAVAVLSSIWPSYWAARKDPVEAIYRH